MLIPSLTKHWYFIYLSSSLHSIVNINVHLLELRFKAPLPPGIYPVHAFIHLSEPLSAKCRNYASQIFHFPVCEVQATLLPYPIGSCINHEWSLWEVSEFLLADHTQSPLTPISTHTINSVWVNPFSQILWYVLANASDTFWPGDF